MRGFTTVLIVLGAVVLAGCTASPKAASPTGVSPTPTVVPTSSSPSATPTPAQTGPLLTGHGVSPGEVPPTRSAASGPHTSDGALAFAAYFYRALDWSIATSNPYLLKQVSAASCESCSAYIDTMNTVAASGGYSVGARITVDSLAIAHGDLVKAEMVVEVKLRQTAQILVESAGAVPSTYPPSVKDDVDYLYLGWGGAGWTVLEISHA